MKTAAELSAPGPAQPAKRFSTVPSDIAGLADLLTLPHHVHQLRAEVAALRDTIEALRKALPPALVGVSDAARSLSVSEVTVRRMIRQGKLAHVRIGRAVRVNLATAPK